MRYQSFCLFFTLTPLSAATLLPLPQLSLSTLQTHITTTHQLKPVSTRQDANGQYHIRLQQYYHDVPVYGGYVILHSPAPLMQTVLTTPPQKITGQLFQSLAEELGEPPSTYHIHAPQIAATFFKTPHTRTTSHPLIYIDAQQQAHWAYQISERQSLASAHPSIPTAIVSADGQTTYLAWDDLHTLKHAAEAIGYGGNPNVGRFTYGQDKPTLSIRRDPAIGLCTLENRQAKIIDMHQQYEQKTQPFFFACPDPRPQYWTGKENDGYDAINGAHSPSNDALYFAGVVKQLYQDWYHLDPLAHAKERTPPMILRVHFGNHYSNAFWDGATLTFGDGNPQTFYPMVCLGIVAHEISHGFTQQHANLTYIGQSGAINESFSDMATIAAQDYLHQSIRWQVGYEVLKPETGLQAFRYFEHPHQDGRSFESVPEYLAAAKHAATDNIDVHLGSGVFNRLFYLIATAPQSSIRDAFDIMVEANLNYWTPYAHFQDAACGVLYAATALKKETKAIKVALETIGVNPQIC